jgi:uncharacterized membrane protein YccC
MWPRLRQAIQTTFAACISYVIVDMMGVPQGFWAVMTAILVTQANVGASLGLAAERLLGSLLGVVVGGGVALLLVDLQELKFAGLAATVLVLGFFAAKRPSLRIASVTAAIVLLGDPRLGSPITSAEYRMIEVLIGSVVAVLTTLFVFPSRAAPAFAAHVKRTFEPLFSVLNDVFSAALGHPLDANAMAVEGARIRTAFAAGNKLAQEMELEAAGFLADHADPESILRAQRRMWHTEIMLMRAVSQPLPPEALQRLGPTITELQEAVAEVAKHLAEGTTALDPPELSRVETALAAFEQRTEEMRAKGELRALSMDGIIRLMAFDFALGQLRVNLRDIAERAPALERFAGATSLWPWPAKKAA